MECILLHYTFQSPKVFSLYIFTLLMIRTPNTTNNKQEKSNTHIHYRSHSLLSTYTVIQGGGVKLALTSHVSEVMRSQRYCHSWKGDSIARSFVFYVMFCTSLFSILSLFFWPLYCLSFIDVLFRNTLWYFQAFFVLIQSG